MLTAIKNEFVNLINKSKKEDWKSSMLEAFDKAAPRIIDIIKEARKIPASSVQVTVFNDLARDVTLVGLILSAGCEANVFSFNRDTKVICLIDELVDHIREVRYPLMKPKKKNNLPFGIYDVGSILQSMPLYFRETVKLPFPDNWDMLSYVEGINEGIECIEGDIYVPVSNDFRGRLYAATDIANYTSDKLQRHALLIEGLPTVALDTRSSCILLTSLMMRDNKALRSVFTLGLKNHKVDPYNKVFDQLPTLKDIERDTKKKCIMQYIYCGNAKVREVCQEQVDNFVEAFMNALPKSQEFRSACLEGWDDDASQYSWKLPDGFEVVQKIEKVLYELGIRELLMEIKFHGKITNIHPNWKVETTLQKGEEGTRSLAPNIIHSIDAYIMRELVRRCYGSFKVSLEDIKRTKNNKFSNPKASTIYSMFKVTGMISLNILNYLSKDDELCEEYYDAIKSIVDTLPKNRFYIKPIHDEFCCREEFRQDMVNVFNRILAELYVSDYGDYISKELNLDFEVDKISKNMIKLIKENNFLLHED